MAGVAPALAAELVGRLSRAGLPLDACVAPVEAWLAGEADARLAMVPALGTLRAAGWADAATWLELLASDRSPRIRAAARAVAPSA